jgi:hypothetical protein
MARIGQDAAGFRVFGPARAVTFIPSGIGPFGFCIVIGVSIFIVQAIFFSFWPTVLYETKISLEAVV